MLTLFLIRIPGLSLSTTSGHYYYLNCNFLRIFSILLKTKMNAYYLLLNFFCSICLCSLIIWFQEQQRANIRRNSGACATVIRKPPAASQDSSLKHPRIEKRPLISGEEASSRHKVRATLQLYITLIDERKTRS